jgi:hypothetical protein
MNKAIQLSAEELGLSIPEYTVAGVPCDSFFAHHWYVACNDTVNKDLLRESIDKHLKLLNDDYAVERKSALKEVRLDVLEESVFLSFMQSLGKLGGQHKFPRVVKGEMLNKWQLFLQKPIPKISSKP